MREAYQRPAARRDLIELYIYLVGHADEVVADRFLLSAEETFHQLAQDPSMGSPVSRPSPELQGLRKWRVREFTNVLIFYLPRAEGVSIVRVINSHQDWWTLLGLNSD